MWLLPHWGAQSLRVRRGLPQPLPIPLLPCQGSCSQCSRVPTSGWHSLPASLMVVTESRGLFSIVKDFGIPMPWGLHFELSWRFRRTVGRICTLVLTTCGQEVLLPLSFLLMVERTSPYLVPWHALCCFRHISLNPVTVIPPCSGDTETVNLARGHVASTSARDPHTSAEGVWGRGSSPSELRGVRAPHLFSAPCFWNSASQSCAQSSLCRGGTGRWWWERAALSRRSRSLYLPVCEYGVSHWFICMLKNPCVPGISPVSLLHRLLPPSPGTTQLSQSSALGSPHHTASSHCMVLCMFQCYFLKSSHPLLPPLCPKVCSLRLCLLCCPACRIISTTFLGSLYMCESVAFVFLFLADFTLYNRLWVYPPHLDWLECIPFYS